ncbi:MAG: hypothetical protein KC657_10710 [Myxococcales bacterium]|nr:hypothetical protein [Myxococcales bacterium]
MDPTIKREEELARSIRIHESDGLDLLSHLDRASDAEIEDRLGVCLLWAERLSKKKTSLLNNLAEARHIKRIETQDAKARCLGLLEPDESWRDVAFNDAGLRFAVTQIRGIERDLRKVSRRLALYEHVITSMQLILRRRTVAATATKDPEHGEEVTS